VLQLRVFGAPPAMAEVAGRLATVPGARHVLLTEAAAGGALVTADLGADVADGALEAVRGLGVPDDDIALLRIESLTALPGRLSGGGLVWADLVNQAGVNARPVARYLVLMAMAGVVAAFGVINRNSTLIVGAMAISPDTLPVTAACTFLVLRDLRSAGRALGSLLAGLAVAGVVAGVLTAILDVFGLLPSGFEIGTGGLQGLQTVNVSTPTVAFAAGIAGMLALETRASAAVGVAISVTTIPASAYLGVAAAVGEVEKAAGALLVLAINVAMLVAGGCTALLVQRALARRRPEAAGAPATGGRGGSPGRREA
jgi:uncharacterized hydrophobic protein (TIGR00271 family)